MQIFNDAAADASLPSCTLLRAANTHILVFPNGAKVFMKPRGFSKEGEVLALFSKLIGFEIIGKQAP